MPKTSIDKLRGISPLPKKVTFKAERNGQEEEIEFYVYPFTTGEKLEFKQLGKQLESMDENSDEYLNKSMEQTYYTIHKILKKSVDGITMEDVKALPVSWFETIMAAALSFEGVEEKDFEELKKKASPQQE